MLTFQSQALLYLASHCFYPVMVALLVNFYNAKLTSSNIVQDCPLILYKVTSSSIVQSCPPALCKVIFSNITTIYIWLSIIVQG